MNVTLRDIKIELSRRNFYKYCCTREPEFYNERKPHLKKLCDKLQSFYEGELLKEDGDPYTKLMIRMPPQHGKSRTLVNFSQWVLGKNNNERIITGSHGDDAATDFSKFTRDGIMEEANTLEQIVYSDIFPDTKVKRGSSSYKKWALEGQHFNYLGVGYGGSVTGKGATLRIIDDLVKDAAVAMNETALRKLWVWLSGTFSSRNSAEGGEVKEIFCATLWAEGDPQAILEATEGDEWYIISMPIYDENTGEMLCPQIMNKKAFLKLKKRMLLDSGTKMIFYANYMCIAIDDNESKLFPQSQIKRYSEFPDKEEPYLQYAYIDPADEGKDHYAMPIMRVYTGLNKVFVHDAIFCTKDLDVQEVEATNRINNHKIREVRIETNSIGAAHRRRIVKLNPSVEITGQFSKAKKMARMLTVAGIVKNFFYFPENPNPELKKFMDQMFKLMKTSKTEDDAPDSICGAAAHLERKYELFWQTVNEEP